MSRGNTSDRAKQYLREELIVLGGGSSCSGGRAVVVMKTRMRLTSVPVRWPGETSDERRVRGDG